jgi:hypothetical protein
MTHKSPLAQWKKKPLVELKSEIHTLQALSNRLTRSAELHKKERNFPMQMVCLIKKRKVDIRISELMFRIPEKVSFD